MNGSILTTLSAAIGVALCTSAAAAADVMTKEQYRSAKERIESEYRSARVACDPLRANAKDICTAQAKGHQEVALAKLIAANRPCPQTRYDARIAQAQADFSVDKEKCDDRAGNAKDVCMKTAASARTAATADAKVEMKTADARNDARADKRDAEYDVAKEKCAALAGNPRDICVSNAKARYGKS